MTELEQKIFDFIECHYKAKFQGVVQVIQSDGDYCLSLTLNNYMIPLKIFYQCDNDDQFYTYITKELIKRNLVRVGYFKLVLENGKNETQ